MKSYIIIALSVVALSFLFPFTRRPQRVAQHTEATTPAVIAETTEPEAISDFEKAVQIIKKYEGLHQPKHYPLVGYGHMVLKGEKFSRTKALSEADADALLRKDLLKNCAVFREFGADSLLLGVLAYNIGSGAAMRSSVAKKLKAGDRDIYANYIAHCRYKGKVNSQIKRRRIEEFETLFIKDLNTAEDPDAIMPGDSFPSFMHESQPATTLAFFSNKTKFTFNERNTLCLLNS